MSFYGSISDRSRTDLKFDKIYPNRFLMDKSANNDDVFVGRYVLVNYEGGYKDLITPNIDIQGEEIETADLYCLEKNGKYFVAKNFKFYENDIAAKDLIAFDENSDKVLIINPHNHFFNFNLTPRYVRASFSSDYGLRFSSYVSEDAYNSFYEVIEKERLYIRARMHAESHDINPDAENFDLDEYIVLNNILPPEPLELPTYYMQDDRIILDEENTSEGYEEVLKEINSLITKLGLYQDYEPNYVFLLFNEYHIFNTSKEKEVIIWVANQNKYFYGGNFLDEENISFNIDEYIYNSKRGYDSTVWEKIYKDNEYQYIKIADLNSLTPSFKLELNSPTSAPKNPIVEPYGDNLNYKISWQPSWGFRIKSAENVQIPVFSADGKLTNQKINSSMNHDNWRDNVGNIKSDAITTWDTEFFNPQTKSYIKHFYNTETNNWDSTINNQKDMNIPAAIYLNKAGFSKENCLYSNGSMTPPDMDATYLSQNYIKVEPTGYSGNTYIENGEEVHLPDTQELSIMLPILGDSICSLWDIIYSPKRNFDYEWKDGSLYDPLRQGVRMAPGEGGATDGGLLYEPGNLNSLVGCINTVHDLIGMIVVEDEDVQHIDNNRIGENFIYYDKITKQYYQKQLNKVISTEESKPLFSPVDSKNIKNFENIKNEKYYYKVQVDLNKNFYYNYIFDPIQIQTDREYVAIKETKVDVLKEYGIKYQPGVFYHKKGVLGTDWQLSLGFDSALKDGGYYEVELKDVFEETEKDIYSIDEIHSLYFPYYYYYQIPIFDDFKNLIDKKYILDTSMEGFKYPEVLPGYNWWTTINDAPQEYLDNYYNHPVKYYLPKKIFDENGNALMIPAKTTIKEIYNKNNFEYKILDNNKTDEIIGPTIIPFYIKEDDEYILIETILQLNNYVKQGHIIYTDVIQAVNQEVLEFDEDESQFYTFDFKYKTDKIYYRQKKFNNDNEYARVMSFENLRKIVEENDPTTRFYYQEQEQKIEKVYNDPEALYIELDNTRDYPGSYQIVQENYSEDTSYYKITEVELEESNEPISFFVKNKYYKQLEDGTYQRIKDFSEITDDIIYSKNDLVVAKDENGIFNVGSIWNKNINEIPEGVTLGVMRDEYQMVPLKGFARNINTILGMIVKINNVIRESDIYTRDRNSIQGVLNYLNDIIDKIDELYGNELVFTDQFGRIHAPKESVRNTDWISLKINKDSEMYLEAIHNNAKVPINAEVPDFSTIDEIELIPNTTSPNDSISFLVPSTYLDEKGHVYGIKTIKYTIPVKSLLDDVANELIDRIDALEKRSLGIYPQGIVGEDGPNNTFNENEPTHDYNVEEEDNG